MTGSISKLGEIKRKWPEFTKACKKGPFKRFLEIAKIPGILEYQDERTKKTCLHFACENESVETLKWILGNFARLDEIINLTDSLNRSAIFFAARSSVQESVRLLKERGAIIRREDWILDSSSRWVIHHKFIEKAKEEQDEEIRLRVKGTSIIVSKSTLFSARARGSYFEILFGSSHGAKKMDRTKQSHGFVFQKIYVVLARMNTQKTTVKDLGNGY